MGWVGLWEMQMKSNICFLTFCMAAAGWCQPHSHLSEACSGSVGEGPGGAQEEAVTTCVNKMLKDNTMELCSCGPAASAVSRVGFTRYQVRELQTCIQIPQKCLMWGVHAAHWMNHWMEGATIIMRTSRSYHSRRRDRLPCHFTRATKHLICPCVPHKSHVEFLTSELGLLIGSMWNANLTSLKSSFYS